MKKIKLLLMSLMTVVLGACGSAPAGSLVGLQGTPGAVTKAMDTSTQLEVENIDRLRKETRLAESRTAALEALEAHPGNGEILWRASRAESDEVYLLHEEDSEIRDEAAGKALQLAKEAIEAGASSLDARAQYAWAMGNATHLQPMFARSKHARSTEKVIENVLSEEVEQPTALATAALLQYRLATLPTMIKIMAPTAPSSDLARAERYARAAHHLEPSRLNTLILSKILVARDRKKAAADYLYAALKNPAQYPRDTEVTSDLKALLAKCNS